VKRKALEDEESFDSDNLNKYDDELYRDTIEQFPELRAMKKEDVIEQIKATLQKKVTQQHTSEDSDVPTRKIFIDHVICNDTKFNDAEVRDHVYTVVAAGSETTALQTAHTSNIQF
jgi:cytochrome P450